MEEQTKKMIENAIEYIDNSDFILSVFIGKLLRISYKINDNVLKFMVQIEQTEIESDERKRIRSDFRRDMMNNGLNSDQFNTLYQTIITDWMKRRELPKRKEKEEERITGKTISALENDIDIMKKHNELLTVPDNLHQVDKYFLNNKYTEGKQRNLICIANIELVLGRIKSFFIDYLFNLEQRQLSSSSKKVEKEAIMPLNKKVFIVHGRNEGKWRELVSILKELNLEPIELSEQPGGANSMMDKFEKYANECSVAIAVISGDDFVGNNSEDKYYQSRPNVWIELGWFYAKLGKANVLLIYEENKDNIIPSDLSGVHRLQYKKNISETYRDLKKELELIGVLDSEKF